MIRRLRKFYRFLSGISCVLILLSLCYIYLFTVQMHQSTSPNDISASYQRALLSKRLRAARSVDLQPKSNPNVDEGWTTLNGNVTVHVGKFDNPHNFSYLINNDKLCASIRPNALSLLIYIESDIGNFDRRQAIRDSWAQLSLQDALNFRIVFLLGESDSTSVGKRVMEESYRYGDLVQENFKESFRNLALKSVMGLKWVTQHCSNANFVMKTDDDIFIHVPNLLTLLKELKELRGDDYVVCHRNRLRNIVRESLLADHSVPPAYRKYLVRENELPGQYYPPYCAGFGYVVPASTARTLYRSSIETPYFFIEDALITGFCRQKSDIELLDHAGFTLRPPVSPKEGSCAFREGRVTSQEMGPSEMRELWREINTRGFFCPQVIGYIPVPGSTL